MGNAKLMIREAYGEVRGRPGGKLFGDRAPEGVPKRSEIDLFMIFAGFRPLLGQAFR